MPTQSSEFNQKIHRCPASLYNVFVLCAIPALILVIPACLESFPLVWNRKKDAGQAGMAELEIVTRQ